MHRAALARRDAADHLGAVGDRLLGMERAILAGEALGDDLGFSVDEDRHQRAPCAAERTAATIFCAASSRSSAGMTLRPDFAQDLLAEIDVGAFEAHHQRHLEADLLHRGDHALGDDVAAHDAAEDVDQNALHVGVGGDDLERRRHLVLRGAAADVEEVGGAFAVELDDVHRRHGEAGAVDHAADRAVERDVVEVVLGRLDLLGVLLGLVAQRENVGVAIERVVVEGDLGVEHPELAVGGDDQRVDLEHRHVLGDEGGVELGDQRLGLLGEFAGQAERARRRAAVVRHDAGRRVDREAMDLFRRLVGDVFDVDAALGRQDERRPGSPCGRPAPTDRARGRSTSRPRYRGG